MDNNFSFSGGIKGVVVSFKEVLNDLFNMKSLACTLKVLSQKSNVVEVGEVWRWR